MPKMKRIAVISSDKMLERTVVLALECAATGRVEVVAAGGRATEGSLPDVTDCDTVVVIGAGGFASGRLSARRLRGAGVRRPQIFVVSWQHNEQTVMGLIECGVDQYMTFPLSLRRLCVKLLGTLKK